MADQPGPDLLEWHEQTAYATSDLPGNVESVRGLNATLPRQGAADDRGLSGDAVSGGTTHSSVSGQVSQPAPIVR
jgi:hypothetical protein